ncbi:MAG: NifB/NifX family molybdenum-iron cluster-binding protein [Candidatus Omnitrophica bacterium]|nr:NifB/NifX family molybdenum-iron cluster-binding protein [Candidatus Omnitrophota bacterium]
MKVAISTDSGHVSAHFGRCPAFTLVEFEDGKVLSKEEISNPGHHPGYLPEFLKKEGADVIVAGGMGQRALELFSQSGIQVVVGVGGKIDEVITKLVENRLEGGESLCKPGDGKGYGIDKTECSHPDEKEE